MIHGKVRLAVMSLLSTLADADFAYLRDQIGTTDGNLSVHLRKLERAKYITVKKRFVGNKPRTTHRITKRGRDAFANYLRALKLLLRLDAPDSATAAGRAARDED